MLKHTNLSFLSTAFVEAEKEKARGRFWKGQQMWGETKEKQN